MKRSYQIAVLPGDGIGPEVCQSAVEVTRAAVEGGASVEFTEHPCGSAHFLETGHALPSETLEACRAADAVLHGAAGLPGVTRADGTEAGLDISLNLRAELDLYANVRPIRLYAGVPTPLAGKGEGDIDYVIVRENGEGLYASRGGGCILRDEVATDTLIVTRRGVERVCHRAFELARQRSGAPADGVRRVTLVDKANVLRSYAFFRRIFDEVAREYPDVESEHQLVDAMTVHLVRRPERFDVVVTENLFGDILSDLGAATIGGMGMAPSAELGDRHGFFQAAHGSAPDIAGLGIANPYGTVLSAASMLDWLAARHQDGELARAAGRVREAVRVVLAAGSAATGDLGGSARNSEATAALCAALGDPQTRRIPAGR